MKKVLLAVLLLSGLAFGQTSVYTHDFSADSNSSTLPTGWSVVAGTMRIQGGQLQCTSGPCIAIYTGATFSSDHYATIKVSGYTSAIGQGLVVREASNSAYYKTACTTASSGTCTAVRLYRVATTLNTFNSGVSIAGSSGTQTLQVVGSTLTVLANGSSIGTSTDATYATGSIGVYFAGTSTTNGVTWFDAGNMGNPPAATPTFTAAPVQIGGTITFSTASTGCSPYIFWNTTGSPTTSDNNSTSATMGSSTTTYYAKVIGCPSFADSTVGSQTYSVNAAPTISPAPGSYFLQQSISMSCAAGTPHYTLDGSAPTSSSTTYSGAFAGASSGSQTIKGICAGTNADSLVTTNTYSIAPSDVSIITDNFSWGYDANLAMNHVQQMPFDYGPTRGRWTAVGGIVGSLTTGTSSGIAMTAVATSVVAPVTSGNAVGTSSGSSGTPLMAAYTGKAGLSADQWAAVKLPASLAGGVCVRCATDGSNNGYYLKVTPSAGPISIELGKVVSGTKTAIATSSAVVTAVGSSAELRVLGNQLQPLVNGSTPSGMSAVYTDSSLTTGSCGIVTFGGYVSDFSCGNVGVADSTTTPAINYPTYTDAAMSASSWTMGYPWFQAALPYTVSLVNPRWEGAFSPKQISGSLYGIGLTSAVPGTISYRGGSFGSEHWQKVKVAVEPTDPDTNNWFVPLQHQTFAPGTDGGCAAAGVTAGCYDSVSYYPGVETVRHTIIANGAATSCAVDPNKVEYACTPFMHITKVTPAASPANDVITVAGSFYTPRKGDDIFVMYRGSKLYVACKGNAANSVAWQASHAYTLGTFILDSNGNWQVVKTAGTSGSGSHPTWYAGWTQSTASGDTTNDGTVVWESYGAACPTTSTFSWVIDAPDSDLNGASGIPALWAGQYSGANPPVFYDWSAGTATASTSMSVIGIAEPSSYQPAPWMMF